MKNHLHYLEIQYSSRMCLGAESEELANIWLNSLLKSCIYSN
jgi:hypothetical protein